MTQPAIRDPFLQELANPLARRREAGDEGPLELPPEAPPDAVLEAVRTLLSDGRASEARQLAVEAAARFPGHAPRYLRSHLNLSCSTELERFLANPLARRPVYDAQGNKQPLHDAVYEAMLQVVTGEAL